jgi:hypothetical protein
MSPAGVFCEGDSQVRKLIIFEQQKRTHDASFFCVFGGNFLIW